MKTSRGVDILLVEDNPDHAEFTLKALADGTIANRTFWVKDGEEALDFLHRRRDWADEKAAPRPGLILLDINLPKLDGHEVLRRVKNDASFREIPVIMLTTSSKPDEVTASYRAGANSFVTKPVMFSQFVDHIKSLKQYWTLTSQLPAA
jgi:two-component system, response regulator